MLIVVFLKTLLGVSAISNISEKSKHVTLATDSSMLPIEIQESVKLNSEGEGFSFRSHPLFSSQE